MRLSGIWSRIANRLREKKQAQKSAATRLKVERLCVEALEDRTLLATSVVPGPVRVGDPQALTSTALGNNTFGNAYNPALAANPLNPQQLVTVYSQRVAGPPTIWRLGAQVSNDGGQTWTSFSPFFQRTDPETGLDYTRASSPSVTWDRQGNFYIVGVQHSDDYHSGALVYAKFNYNPVTPTSTPTNIDERILEQWFNQEPIYNPTIAIDNNVPSYTDPVTGDTLVDTMSGKALYIAYNTNTQNTEQSRNPTQSYRGGNGIRIMASSDGGATFTNPEWLNSQTETTAPFNNVPSFGPTTQQISSPQILFTQGSLPTPGSTIPAPVLSGQMIVAYSNGGTIRVDTSQPDFDPLALAPTVEKRVADTAIIAHPGAFILDAGAMDVEVSTEITVYINDVDDRALQGWTAQRLADSIFININTIDKSIQTISDLDVAISMRHLVRAETEGELELPDGTIISLWEARTTNPARPAAAQNRGLTAGVNLGAVPGPNGLVTDLPAIFDQQAAIDIRGGQGDYIGRFRPIENYASQDSLPTGPSSMFNLFDRPGAGLNTVVGYTRDQLLGAWTLRITDHIDTPPVMTPPFPPANRISTFELRFSSNFENNYFGTDFAAVAAADEQPPPPPATAAASATNDYAAVNPVAPNGIAPTVRLAQDTTLGSFSPYQGRVYMSWATGGAGSQVGVIASDTAGSSWIGLGRQVNDDSDIDNINSAGTTRGRAQFAPAITVDQQTGAVVMTWYDARYDASNARVATFMSVSVDGGEHWSVQDRKGVFGDADDEASFLNAAKTAIDAATGKRIIIEPIPSNQSVTGSPTIDNYATATGAVSQGFGWQMGVVAHGGRLTAVWAGNNNTVNPQGIGGSAIFSNQATYTAGPRIIETSAGPVINDFRVDLLDSTNTFIYKTVSYNTTFGPDGRRRLDSFIVQFDRPINADTFTPEDVQVMFRGAGTPTTTPGTMILVSSVVPLNDDQSGGFGPRAILSAGQFASYFRVILATPQTAVGTYSWAIGPNVHDAIRDPHPVIAANSPATFSNGSSTPNLAISDDATVNTDTITLANPGANQVIRKVTVTVDITHPYRSDLLLSLLHPDGTTRVILGNRKGGPTPGGPITANINSTFDDAATSTVQDNGYAMTVRPETPLATFIGMGIEGDWTLEITDLDGNIVTDVGTLNSWSLSIETGTITTDDADDLLGNRMDQDGDGLIGEDLNNSNLLRDYQLNGTLADSATPAGPALTNNFGSLGTTSLSFFANFGPSLTGGLANNANYAIEFAFSVSTVSGFVKLIDFKDKTVDNGLYINNGALRFFPQAAGALATIPANQLVTVLLSRDGNTGIVTGFVNGVQQFSFPDLAGDAIFSGPGSVIHFLQDDNATGGSEASSGVLDYIKIYDGPRTPLGLGNNDIFANPKPLNGRPFELPFDENTLPLIVPGPYVLTTAVAGQAPSVDNLALNKTVQFIDVTFDRDIRVSTFTAADIVRVLGPLGEIAGPFTVTAPFVPVGAVSARTFRVGLPSPQVLSGQYSIVLGSNIQATSGESIDANHNAGLETLRGTTNPAAGGQQQPPVSYDYPGQPQVIAGNGATVTSTISVPDAIRITSLTVSLNLTTPDVKNLVATLVGPDGTSVLLFDGSTLRPGSGTVTVKLDDTAANPIQNTSNFAGTFKPQKPLSAFIGRLAQGSGATAWKLFITNRGIPSQTATLNDWSLEMTYLSSATGLGEPVADQSTVSFRIFTQAVDNAASRNNWTAVGPTATGINPTTGQAVPDANGGQITDIAVDPSDVSGNTVYAVAAHSGIWKTTNFLTTSAAGPVWMPLTDFGSTQGIGIGSIVLLPRSNDPNKTIVIAATGSGANEPLPGPAGQGIGFLRSEDGGKTWKVLDSLTNYNAAGYIPLQDLSRGRQFNGMVNFKLIADPNPVASTNENVIYAAMSGTGGGLYGSNDSGKNWRLIRAGQATDIALAQSQLGSGGNVDTYWVGFKGANEGIYLTTNGDNWITNPTAVVTLTRTLATGGQTLLRDGQNGLQPAVPVTNSTNPNTLTGRITLATPGAIPASADPSGLLNLTYSDWVYALVEDVAEEPIPDFSPRNGGTVVRDTALYVSKDRGFNWTKVTVPQAASLNTATNVVGTFSAVTGDFIPTNDETIGFNTNGVGTVSSVDFDPTFGNGEETLALAIDPRDPRIVYVGGTRLIRIDLTTMSDPYSLVSFDYSDRDDDGDNRARTATVTNGNVEGAVQTKTQAGVIGGNVTGIFNPFTLLLNPAQDYYNLRRNPDAPFTSLSTILTYGVARFNNDGRDIVWNFHDLAETGNSGAGRYYRLMAMPDPVTGQTRLVMSTLNGIYTSVAQANGDIQTDIGNQVMLNGSRNGNIQNIRLVNAGAQPSQLAADVADALFYAATTTRGFPQSTPDILNTGDLRWTSSFGGGTEVMTDPSGNGFIWKYHYPGTLNVPTDFVQLEMPGGVVVGRTGTPGGSTGLVQAGENPGNPLGNGVGQWNINYLTALDIETPSTEFFGSRMAINSYDSEEMLIGSQKVTPQVFLTTDRGLSWEVIASPADIGNSFAFTLAFGAPAGVSTDQFVYAGTVAGQLFFTLDKGGVWTDRTLNLDRSTIRTISPNPTKGSFEVYVLTSRGVYWKADIRTATPWTNITGAGANNLFSLETYLFNDPTQRDRIIYGDLTKMVVDWRFERPGTPVSPTAGTHPYLYVGAEGGVFRSVDAGRTWTYFPGNANAAQQPTVTPAGNQGAAQPGGMLPRIKVTDLVLLPGGFNAATGETDPNNPFSMLLATTDGRGAFAIRLEPESFVPGPRILSVLPTTPSALVPMTSVDIRFDKGVDPTTFTVADILSFRTAAGVNIVPISLTNISTGGQNNLFRLTFAGQIAPGAYTIVIGPNVSDFAGNKMNQTPDGVNGDLATDTYTGRFFRTTGPNGPFVPGVVGGLPSGVYVASYSKGLTVNGSGYTRQPFYTYLPPTVTWTNITVRDFNADGKDDVAGLMLQTGEWWVSLAAPGGYETSRWLSGYGTAAFVTPTFNDYNGDNRVDLAYRNKFTGDWMVALSTGEGFQPTSWGVWNLGAIPINCNIASADFNGDGLDDISARNPATGRIWVGLSTGESFVLSLWGTSIRGNLLNYLPGDFNGDGKFDVAARTAANNWIVLQTNATGTGVIPRAFGSWPAGVNTSVVAADFNGDGRWDVAGTYLGNSRLRVPARVYVGLSNGSVFATRAWATLPSGVPYSFYGVGDFNRDGRQDMAIRRIDTRQIYLLRSNGAAFAVNTATVLPAGASWVSAGVGDFNGDGASDLLNFNPFSGRFLISQSNGVANFGSVNFALWMASSPLWSNVLVGDFNGDGKDDLAYRSLRNYQWYVSISNGSQAFRTREWLTWPGGNWIDVKVGDFNGDGKDDIVGRRLIAGNRWEVAVSISDGEKFSYQTWTTWSPGNWVNTVVGDFNNDGRDDLAARNLTTGQVWVSRSTGISFAWLPWTTWAKIAWADVVVGDFNGDGRDDLATRQPNTGRWFTSISTGAAFTGLVNRTAVPWPTALVRGKYDTWLDVRVLDINRDGKDDLIGRNSRTGELWAAVSNPAGTAFNTNRATVWGVPQLWREVFATDIDGDGDDDLIGRIFSSGVWRVSQSNGAAALSNANWDVWLANFVLSNPGLLRKS